MIQLNSGSYEESKNPNSDSLLPLNLKKRNSPEPRDEAARLPLDHVQFFPQPNSTGGLLMRFPVLLRPGPALLEQNKTCCLIHSSQGRRVRGGEGRGEGVTQVYSWQKRGKEWENGRVAFSCLQCPFCCASFIHSLLKHREVWATQNRETGSPIFVLTYSLCMKCETSIMYEHLD